MKQYIDGRNCNRTNKKNNIEEAELDEDPWNNTIDETELDK